MSRRGIELGVVLFSFRFVSFLRAGQVSVGQLDSDICVVDFFCFFFFIRCCMYYLLYSKSQVHSSRNLTPFSMIKRKFRLGNLKGQVNITV